MRIRRVWAITLISTIVVSACGGTDTTQLKTEVVENYATVVYDSYRASLESANSMAGAIDAFLASPDEESLTAAKQAWIDARDDYSPTEAFRFYGGPIDNEDAGPEGLINAWPLDEAYIDYVEGSAEAGIINSVDAYPVIDASLVESLNEEGGETNISTGWHAIEFLLWGQDLSADGPGTRPYEDYTTKPNADRRATYLATTTTLLVGHLEEMVEAWAPDTNNYRADFEALPTGDAIAMIMTGIGELSRGELAGERMTVAYEARSQEDEHSCFSDNTIADIVGNAVGVQRVFLGGSGEINGPGIYDLIASQDQGLADRLRGEIEASIDLARSIPAPFDQHLGEGVSDDDPGRSAIFATIVSLEAQTDTLVEAADLLEIDLNLS